MKIKIGDIKLRDMGKICDREDCIGCPLYNCDGTPIITKDGKEEVYICKFFACTNVHFEGYDTFLEDEVEVDL